MSGASTMRNAVKRIEHKERSQPHERKKLGLLEKHKDYVERAHDYKKKQALVKNLRKKAEGKNPDEFYFRMNNSEVKSGIHRAHSHKEANKINGDSETIKLLKAQDMGYLAMKKAIDDSKIQKLRSSLHFIGEKQIQAHRVFVDSSSEMESFDPAAYFDTASDDVFTHSFNRPRLHDSRNCNELNLEGSDTDSAAAPGFKNAVGTVTGKRLRDRTGNSDDNDSGSNKGTISNKKKSTKSKAYKELYAREKRSKQLKNAMGELELQRQLSWSKGTKKKIVIPASITETAGTSEKVLYKWKRHRSR